MNDLGQLRVVKAGVMVTAQDAGRIGGQHLGLCQSGAADAYSFYWSNILLGNPAATPVLEVCLGGFELEFHHATQISLCGADMSASLNGKSLENWRAQRINAGDYLRFGYARFGLRSYLSVLGGLLLQDPVCGSFASVPRESTGFNQGEPLRAGMSLSYKRFDGAALRGNGNRALARRFIPDYSSELKLKTYPVYQYGHFDEEQRLKFCRGSYTVDSASDRMGYRFMGEPLIYRGGKIISEGIALGAVQIPADGQPIVLLHDRQTIGGYPKIGCVTRSSCSKLSQRKPGDKVSFSWQAFSQ